MIRAADDTSSSSRGAVPRPTQWPPRVTVWLCGLLVAGTGCASVPARLDARPTDHGTALQQAGQVNAAATLESFLASPEVRGAVGDFLQTFSAELHASAEVALATIKAQASATQTVQQGDQGKAQGLGVMFGDGDTLTTLLLVVTGCAVFAALVGALIYAYVLRPLGIRGKTPAERRAARAQPCPDADSGAAEWIARHGLKAD